MLGNGSFTRTYGAPSAAVYPQFFVEAVQDPVASAAAGRPIFREEERVEIIMPGISNLTRPVERVSDEHRQRWPKEYEAFKAGREVALTGTPIEEWPRLNKAQVRELKYFDVRTVEDIANLSDAAGQRIGIGWTQLRDTARAFLDDAEHLKQNTQLSAEVDSLKSQNAALKNQVEELGVLMREMHAQLMAQKNAPHPVATAIPGLYDPVQAPGYAAAAEAAGPARERPSSSLGQFARSERRRRGQPKDEAAAA